MLLVVDVSVVETVLVVEISVVVAMLSVLVTSVTVVAEVSPEVELSLVIDTSLLEVVGISLEVEASLDTDTSLEVIDSTLELVVKDGGATHGTNCSVARAVFPTSLLSCASVPRYSSPQGTFGAAGSQLLATLRMSYIPTVPCCSSAQIRLLPLSKLQQTRSPEAAASKYV